MQKKLNINSQDRVFGHRHFLNVGKHMHVHLLAKVYIIGEFGYIEMCLVSNVVTLALGDVKLEPNT